MRPPSAICPRCGYDLSGVVHSWNQTCPLEGTCSECGLALDWRDVLRPELVVPKWFIECRFPRPALSVCATLWRALFPWKFWTTVRISWPIRPNRLVLLALGVLLAAHLAVAAGSALNVYLKQARWTGGPYFSAIARTALWPYSGSRGPWENLPVLSGAGWLIPLTALLAPVGYFALPRSLARVRIRRAHLLRGWTYSFSILGASALLLAVHAALGAAPRGSLLLLLYGLTHPKLVGLGCAIGLLLHWFGFTVYLRLSNELEVTVAMLVLAFLLALLIQVLRFWITLDTESWLI